MQEWEILLLSKNVLLKYFFVLKVGPYSSDVITDGPVYTVLKIYIFNYWLGTEKSV